MTLKLSFQPILLFFVLPYCANAVTTLWFVLDLKVFVNCLCVVCLEWCFHSDKIGVMKKFFHCSRNCNFHLKSYLMKSKLFQGEGNVQ